MGCVWVWVVGFGHAQINAQMNGSYYKVPDIHVCMLWKYDKEMELWQ
jgi:hypothetical protein